MTQRYFLGIDGGGTGCRAALTDAAGKVLARAEGGPANIHTHPEVALSSITQVVQRLTADIPAAAITAALGLAGANVPKAVERLRPALPFARHVVVNDGITATYGALGDADGILAAIGTGSIFAVRQGASITLYGGKGFLLGDQGAGAPLGRALLARALYADEGFAPSSPLLVEVMAEMGGSDGIMGFASTAAPADYAALSPRILKAAADGDPAATDLLDAAAAEVEAILHVLQTKAGMLQVTFLGGLGPYYAGRLSNAFQISPPKGTGLDGALMLARSLGDLPPCA